MWSHILSRGFAEAAVKGNIADSKKGDPRRLKGIEMPGTYYFNCNGPVAVGPWGNCNEARQDAENQYGGPCTFLGCSEPPCGCDGEVARSTWTPDAAFIEAAAKRAKRR